MIDSISENIVSLADAAKSLPARRGGKRPHVSCIYRWTVSGCRGVKLESIQVGGTRCTSLEALHRFFERLSVPPGGRELCTLARTPVRSQKASEQAERELREAGY